MGTVNQVEMDSSDEEPMETGDQNGTQEDLNSSQGKFLRVESPPGISHETIILCGTLNPY